MTMHLHTSTANAGVAFQMLMDRPDLAANVRSLSINGVDGWRGHPVHFYVDGGEVELLAWKEYLGPAAQTMQVQRDTQWHSNVTTKDVHVTVTHDLKAEVK